MSTIRRFWMVSAAAAAVLAAAGCVPPPEGPEPTVPQPACWDGNGYSSVFLLQDLIYLGPANTAGNARWYPSTDGTCTGTAYPFNLATGGTVNEVREACVAMTPNYRGTPEPADEFYAAAPGDLWLC